MIHNDSTKKKVTSSLTKSQWENQYLEHSRGNQVDIIPFPDEKIQQKTNGQKGEETAQAAISILDCIMACVNEVITPTKDMHILDYGCGWGRITRLLPFYFNEDCITGVDEILINSANNLLPFMNHRTIKSMEALPFESDSFDIIFANSVFSHLSEKSCLFTLSELSRTLKKNGVLIVSVLEENVMTNMYANEQNKDWITNILGKQSNASNTLHKEGFVWGDTGRWNEYGIAIMNDNWISEQFEKIGIRLHGTKHGVHHGTQSYKFGTKN